MIPNSITTLLVITIIVITVIAQVPMCNNITYDVGDPESIQLAQLEALRCLSTANTEQFKNLLASIERMHADTISVQNNTIDAIKQARKPTSLGSILGYIILSLIFSYLFCSIMKLIWFLIVQKVDCIAEILWACQNARHQWWNSATPSFDTLDAYRRSRPIPLLLVVICCCRCKPSPVDGCV